MFCSLEFIIYDNLDRWRVRKDVLFPNKYLLCWLKHYDAATILSDTDVPYSICIFYDAVQSPGPCKELLESLPDRELILQPDFFRHILNWVGRSYYFLAWHQD